MPIIIRFLMVYTLIIALFGCATSSNSDFRITSEVPIEQEADVNSIEKEHLAKKNTREVYEFVGNDEFISDQKIPIRRIGGDKIQVNFRNAPLKDITEAILGDMLNAPYTIEGEIKGAVTFSSSSPIAEEALLGLLESLLVSHGIAMVHTEDNIIRLGPAKELRSELPILINTQSKLPGYSVQIVTLEYISVLEAQKILASIGADKNLLYSDTIRNLLMVAAPASQMENIHRTLKMFDVDVLKGMSFGIYEIFNATPKVVVERFNELLGGPDLKPFAGVVKLVPMEELNSIMVITSRSHFLPKIKDWIQKLDKINLEENAGSVATELFIYNVQNGEASQLADLLTQVFGGLAKIGLSSSSKTSGDTAPGYKPKVIGEAKNGLSQAQNMQNSGGKQPQIVANEANNSILVMADPQMWRSIKSTLRKLDVAPAQVLVEVSIWEVTLDNSLRYGVEWFFENELNSGDLGLATLDLNSTGINATVPGFSYLISDIAGGWKAVIDTLDKESVVEVLSSPSILVLDNQTAEINVGDQQPVRTGTSVSDGGTVTENIQFKDTGVRLSVKPRVNAGGLVIMEIDQEVTDVGNIDTATGQRAFLRRNISSMVAIQSGDTIVLGGLIQQNKSDGSSGLPFLSRIPIMGGVFGSQSNDLKRTELLITISPRAITRYRDFVKVGEEIREKMARVRAAFETKEK